MKNNKSLLNHAIKAGIFSLTLFSTTQIHAESQPIKQILPVPYFIDELYAKTDIDGDGMISAEEHYALHTAKALLKFEVAFKAIDENGDGLAQQEEYLRFLPAMDETVLIKQFIAAAGSDELLDSEEFSVMRLKEQGVDNESMWEFATLDMDHDGKLAPHEFYTNRPDIIDPSIEPPILIIEPKPIGPPPEITNPDTVVTLPDGTVIHPDGTVIYPDESTTDSGANRPADPQVFIGPPNPVDPIITQVIDGDLANSLKEKLARMEEKLTRLDKSILMTTKRIMNTTDGKKLARLERRLKRQTEKSIKLQDFYQTTLKELSEAQ